MEKQIIQIVVYTDADPSEVLDMAIESAEKLCSDLNNSGYEADCDLDNVLVDIEEDDR